MKHLVPTLALILLLTLHSWAHAGWTEAEHVQMARLFQGLHDMPHAFFYLSRHLASNPEHAPQVETILRYALPQLENHVGAVLYLCDQEGTLNDTIGQMTRARAILAGTTALQRVNYAPAYTRFQALLRDTPTDTQLKIAERLWTRAEAWREGFDISLAYAEPRPGEMLLFANQTRAHTPVVGPHGDYRRIGENVRLAARSLSKGWLAEIKAVTLYPPFLARYLNDNVTNLARGYRYLIMVAGLYVGIEHPDLVPLIDQARSSATPGRPRQFFQVLLAQEVLINLDHLKEGSADYRTLPAQHDRHVVRGWVYDLLKWNNRTAQYITDHAATAPPAFVATLGQSLYWLGVAWSELDNLAGNSLWLRWCMHTECVEHPEKN